MSWMQCSKKRRVPFSAGSQGKPFITRAKETLAGGTIILAALIGIFMAFCWGQDSDKNFQGTPRKNFLETATTPAFSNIYRVKKVDRNGKELAYVMKLGEKGNLNSNKRHPSKIPIGISPED